MNRALFAYFAVLMLLLRGAVPACAQTSVHMMRAVLLSLMLSWVHVVGKTLRDIEWSAL